ncbi:MAG: Fe-S-cluster containining protein [Desulforhopalus sp.]|jgi:Fe-S-cluster containining protein
MDDTELPITTKPIKPEDSFAFSCHKGVSCFTECCRMLELALSPYDVLRLRHATGKTSPELLGQYIIMEQEPGEPFPRFYLTMVDDGRASCVFVSKEGCTVYGDRPAACRTYPLGRAVQKNTDGSVCEHFIIIQENHCYGFFEPTSHTPIEYTADQELSRYNHFNDLVAGILQHDMIRKGLIPSKKQIELFILALYDLDDFREQVGRGKIVFPDAENIGELSDEELLEANVAWIAKQLFN